jgi:hypothetical protein
MKQEVIKRYCNHKDVQLNSSIMDEWVKELSCLIDDYKKVINLDDVCIEAKSTRYQFFNKVVKMIGSPYSLTVSELTGFNTSRCRLCVMFHNRSKYQGGCKSCPYALLDQNGSSPCRRPHLEATHSFVAILTANDVLELKQALRRRIKFIQSVITLIQEED